MPHFQAPTLHPWFCDTASLCVVGASVLPTCAWVLCPRIVCHQWRLSCLPGCTPLAPEHRPHYDMCCVWKHSLSVRGRRTSVVSFGMSVFCDAFCEEMTHRSRFVLTPSSLLLWFRTLQKPLAASFSCLFLDISSEISQSLTFPKSSQASRRKQSQQRQLHWALNDIKGNPPSSLSRKTRFSLEATSGCFGLLGKGSRLKLLLGISIRAINEMSSTKTIC